MVAIQFVSFGAHNCSLSPLIICQPQYLFVSMWAALQKLDFDLSLSGCSARVSTLGKNHQVKLDHCR
jgi:hypothetical protein